MLNLLYDPFSNHCMNMNINYIIYFKKLNKKFFLVQLYQKSTNELKYIMLIFKNQKLLYFVVIFKK